MARATEAFVNAKLIENGMGTVVFTRFRGGNAETGAFFLDTHCLGVTNAVYALVPETDHVSRVLDCLLPEAERQPMAPAAARKLVEGALNYAQALGFPPASEYRKAARVFGGTNAADCAEAFEFGKEGKPLYVRRRSDSFPKCLRILKQLRSSRGPEGFHFMGACTEEEIAILESEGIRIRQRLDEPEQQLPADGDARQEEGA